MALLCLREIRHSVDCRHVPVGDYLPHLSFHGKGMASVREIGTNG